MVLAGCGLVALIAANFLTLTVYTLLQPLTGWKSHPDAMRENAFYLLALQCIFHALVLLVLYWFLVVNHGLPFWASLKLRAVTPRLARRFVLGGIALALVVQIAPAILPDREDFPLQKMFSSPAAGYAIAVFAVLVAPLMEEILFRGVLFSFFEHVVGLRFAIVGTAVLFAALHVHEYWGAWNHVLLVSMVGLAFSLTRGLTGSLTPSCILHAAYNASLMAALFLQTQGFRTI